MANLPTAYASQRFGNKTLDFYAAAGEVTGSDPRARADERRLEDIDGARHTVRLMEAKFDLKPGEQASVLRLQPGPARRSRPVAVVNHTSGGWTRTHPGASALLSRAGIARNVNWALTMTLFALVALACVWPYMIAFLAEIAPGALSAVPAPDVFALAASAAPGLAGFSFAEFAAPLAGALDAVRPGLGAIAPGLVFAAAAVAGALVVFAARSWRLLWAPLYVAALGVGALGFGGPAEAIAPALAGLGLAAGVFLIGGAWNRIGDAMRLEARIALLADHLQTNAPEETVGSSAEPAEAPCEPAPETGAPDALVDERTAVAVAASLRSLDADAVEAVPVEAEPVEVEPMEAEAIKAEAAPATEGEAERPDTPERTGLDAEEAERLRTDPRYAARAIILPPPPPMPGPSRADAPEPAAPGTPEPGSAAAQPGELQTAEQGELEAIADGPGPAPTRTLNPGKPLPENVVPIFAAPPPKGQGA